MLRLFSFLVIFLILGLGIGFFWLFPFLLVYLIYPVPFFFAGILAFYGKLLFGLRLGRKSLFAISNLALFLAIPLGLHYTRLNEMNFFLYGFFHLFLSLPLSRYIEPPLKRLYEKMDVFDALFQVVPSKKTRFFLSDLKISVKVLPYPKFLTLNELPPDELYGLFWNLSGEYVRWVFVEEFSAVYLLKDSDELFTLPENLLEEEALELFFKQYPDLVLYGILLATPVTIGETIFKNYIIVDIIPKYRGTRQFIALPWQKIQSICKNFNLNKIGEMGAFKQEKIASRFSPKYPEGVSSGYLRIWNPTMPEIFYYKIP
ncbi:MAG: hypothetical protein AABZ60_24965, partial [Planctomycetota bacterium]